RYVASRGFRDGLQSLGVLAALQKYPEKCKLPERGKAVTLEEILIFATGCDSIPPLGFRPHPTLEFQDYSGYPTANTCDNILRIPIKGQNMEGVIFIQNSKALHEQEKPLNVSTSHATCEKDGRRNKLRRKRTYVFLPEHYIQAVI
uniref:HECT domain-containing protein n=1 Tax=Paramormyrops kingsleyae TaxID=1676925 RepID=A0A3B3S980_9TELE